MAREYIRDSLPQCCFWERARFRNRQLSENQNTALVFTPRIRFFTNVNRWNLFTPAQFEMFDRMYVDNGQRYAYANQRFLFNREDCNATRR
jgi:hypothetical protein